MVIGFLLPGNYALARATQGVRVQAWKQVEALRALGHEVLELTPWQPAPLDRLDVIQFFLGGPLTHNIESYKPYFKAALVYAPMIDSMESNWRYRIATTLGSLHPRFLTVPGVMKRNAMGSEAVVVRSTHERDRIVKGMGVDPSKVSIVLNGNEPPPPTSPDKARRELDLPERFVFHVSAYTQERKNVARMLEAIGPLGYPVVVAGAAADGPEREQLRALATQYPQIRLLGHLDYETLLSAYAACDVFCLPSLNEGTGLVGLEAAALGAKIVVTQNGGPPDYYLDMADYVDPLKVDDIRAKVERAWNRPKDDRLAHRVIHDLTWKASAESLVKVYEAAIARRSRTA
ncbi:MAG: glycosyltransferase [Phycisphaerae bacterium]|nr:glycosyltransferase [Phycisphaerae bacterium]